MIDQLPNSNPIPRPDPFGLFSFNRLVDTSDKTGNRCAGVRVLCLIHTWLKPGVNQKSVFCGKAVAGVYYQSTNPCRIRSAKSKSAWRRECDADKSSRANTRRG